MSDEEFEKEIEKLKNKLDLETAFYAGAATMIKLLKSKEEFSELEFKQRIRQSFQSWYKNR